MGTASSIYFPWRGENVIASAGSVCCQYVSSSVAFSNLGWIPKESNRSLNNGMTITRDFCVVSRRDVSIALDSYELTSLYLDLCFAIWPFS